jgi:type IV pilus assembly protein PilC
MPRFTYKAKNGPGKTVEGDLNAESQSAAVAALEAMGCSPIWVTEKEEPEAGGIQRLRRRRVSSRDVTLFTRQLASLTKSGVPILKALSTIGEQTENTAFRRIVEDLGNTIRDGNMLSGALAKYPRFFPEIYINMVRSGESAGMLDTTLSRLADAREREDEIRRKVQAAIAYPLLIVSVGIITVFVLLAFFLPKVVGLFKDYRDLPLPTRILMGVSGFCSANWYWIVLVTALLVVIVKRLASQEKGRAWMDGIKLHLPLVNRFILESEIARFARTLALLIEAGIPIDKALTLSGDTLHKTLLREEIETIRKHTVLQGGALSSGMKKSRFFPPFVSNMTAVGEEAGRLDESLNEVASYYEKDVDQQTRLATSLLEPALILGVGAIVGIIVAAMLLPIFRLSMAL